MFPSGLQWKQSPLNLQRWLKNERTSALIGPKTIPFLTQKDKWHWEDLPKDPVAQRGRQIPGEC